MSKDRAEIPTAMPIASNAGLVQFVKGYGGQNLLDSTKENLSPEGEAKLGAWISKQSSDQDDGRKRKQTTVAESTGVKTRRKERAVQQYAKNFRSKCIQRETRIDQLVEKVEKEELDYRKWFVSSLNRLTTKFSELDHMKDISIEKFFIPERMKSKVVIITNCSWIPTQGGGRAPSDITKLLRNPPLVLIQSSEKQKPEDTLEILALAATGMHKTLSQDGIKIRVSPLPSGRCRRSEISLANEFNHEDPDLVDIVHCQSTLKADRILYSRLGELQDDDNLSSDEL